MERLPKCVLALLKQESVCQRVEEEEEDMDEEDHDHVLMDSVADLVGIMAKVLCYLRFTVPEFPW